MRILQISSAATFAGGERHVVDLTNALARRGHEVFVAVRLNSPLIPHLSIPKENIKILPLRNALDAKSARGLAKLVQANNINIVHAHLARDYSLAAYATRRNASARLVVTRHVLFQLSRFHRRTLAHASSVIAVSAATGNSLKEQSLVAPEKVVVIRNGIDVERLENSLRNFDRSAYRRNLGIPDDCRLVGSMGELRQLKRHDDFIQAAALVAVEFPRVHFVLAGAEQSSAHSERKRLTTLVDELKIQDRFHFLGWLDDSGSFLSSLDVFVSASETESFGLSIAEAMASGAAVVSTATEGAQELIVDGETGLLVPVGDIQKLAAGILFILTNDHRRREFVAHAQRGVAEHFSLQRMVDEVERVYNDIA